MRGPCGEGLTPPEEEPSGGCRLGDWRPQWSLSGGEGEGSRRWSRSWDVCLQGPQFYRSCPRCSWHHFRDKEGSRDRPRLQEITPYKGTVVRRITVSSTPRRPVSRVLASALFLVHGKGLPQMSFNQYCCWTASHNPGPVFANLLGAGRQGTLLCLFGVILPASLGGVVSMWESAWE